MTHFLVVTLAFAVSTNGKQSVYPNALIPNISISSYLEAIAVNDTDTQSQIISLFDTGFNKWGLVRIIDDEISPILLTNTMKGFKDFFRGNNDYKMQYDNGGVVGVPGFVPRGSEKLNAYYQHSDDNDLLEDNVLESSNDEEFREPTESFHIISNWQNTVAMQSGNPFIPNSDECPKEFRSYLPKYYSSMRILLKNIHLIASKALGFNYNIFEKKMVQNQGYLGHRATYYYELLDEMSKIYEIRDGYYLRFQAHRDFASFAFVHNDEIDGFQIKVNNTWYAVQQIANSLLVIGGDFIRFWTNNYWKTALHRVVTQSKKERFTITTFSSTDLNDIIDILPECIKCLQNGQRKFEAVSGTKWIRKRFEDVIIIDDFDYDEANVVGKPNNECTE